MKKILRGLAFTQPPDAVHHPLVCDDNVSRASPPVADSRVRVAQHAPLTVLKHYACIIKAGAILLRSPFASPDSDRPIRWTCRYQSLRDVDPGRACERGGDRKLQRWQCPDPVVLRLWIIITKANHHLNPTLVTCAGDGADGMRGLSHCALIIKLSHLDTTCAAGMNTGAARHHFGAR